MAEPKRKIILTGYRACGKSSVGRALAARLQVGFIDMDEVLVARYGEIRELVREKGWDYFRAREKELLEELVARREGVVATGGGAILHQEVWRKLKKTGLVVWLTADLETICRRLGADAVSDRQRPSLTGSGIKDEAGKVLAEREPLYRGGSDLMIDSTGPLEEVVDEIAKALATSS